MDNILFESFQYWHSQKLQDQTLFLLEFFPDPDMTQFWSVNYVYQVCKLKVLFWTIFTLIGSYLQLLLNIFYHRYTATVFRTVLPDTFWRLWKLLFFEENIFKTLLYLCFFFIQKQITLITQKQLVVESCPTPQ